MGLNAPVRAQPDRPENGVAMERRPREGQKDLERDRGERQ